MSAPPVETTLPEGSGPEAPPASAPAAEKAQNEEGAPAAAPQEERVFGVEVTDLSPQANEHNLREFFQFSGKIKDIQLSMSPEGGHQARIFFEKEEEAETACLLTGAIIVDKQVVITNLFDGAPPPVMGKKAVDVISQMLSAGFIFGKSTLDKLSDFDKKMGLSEKVKANMKSAKEKLNEFNEKHQIRQRASSFMKTVQTKVEGTIAKADDKFKLSEKFNSTASQVQANENVQKVTSKIKFGFSTVSANISKVSNATASKIKTQMNNNNNTNNTSSE
jgi:hypothetical protein